MEMDVEEEEEEEEEELYQPFQQDDQKQDKAGSDMVSRMSRIFTKSSKSTVKSLFTIRSFLRGKVF